MNDEKMSRRIVRRSLHRSRSVLVSVVLVLLILAAVYVGTESVLSALGSPPLVIAPAEALAASSIWFALVAVPGLLLAVLALLPARRARHELPDERMSVIVDDGVLAGAVKHSVLQVARVPADRVRSSVSARKSQTSVVPTSGSPVAHADLEAAATALVESLAPRPAVKVKLTVAEHGVVGS